MFRSSESYGPTEHTLGAAGAPAQLALYGDYASGSCARAHFEVVEILHQLGSAVRFTYRHFPLTAIHPVAFLAAQAAEAAGAQGRFWAMHSMLFANQQTLSPTTLTIYAGALGLDAHRFARELHGGMYASKVTSDVWLGARCGVTTAPTFFLNDVRVRSTARLRRSIDAVLARTHGH